MRPSLAAILFVALLLAVSGLCAPTAGADVFDRFERARASYQAGEYERAAREFSALSKDEALLVDNPMLIVESLKYLGVSLLFMGDERGAVREFEQLLRIEPGYRLDPVVFPGPALDRFEEVRQKLERERLEEERRIEEASEAQRLRELELSLERDLRMKMLEELASKERVEIRNSRGLALLPFGIGQFRNGHRPAGIFFAASQSAFAAMALGTFIAHAALPSANDPAQDRELILEAERRRAALNWGSAGAFTLLYLISIIDAQVRYVPFRVEERERELPELGNKPRARFTIEPDGVGLRF